MFCENCGKPMKDDETLCPDCGTPVTESKPDPRQSVSEPSAPEAGTARQEPGLKEAGTEAAASLKALFGGLGAAILASAPVKKLKALNAKQKKIAAGAAGGAVLLVVLCAVLLGGRGYKKTVDIFVNKGIKDPDAKAVVDLVPDKIFKEAGYDKEDMKEYIEKLDSGCAKQQKQLKELLGKNWKLTYTITEDEPRDEDDLEDIQDDYEDDYDLKVKDARVVKVKLRFKGSKDSESATMRVPLVKIGNSWYIDYVSMGGIRIAPSF